MTLPPNYAILLVQPREAGMFTFIAGVVIGVVADRVFPEPINAAILWVHDKITGKQDG